MKKCLLLLMMLLSLLIGISSCVSKSKYDKLEILKKDVESENTMLRDKITELEKELEIYRFSPEKLCANIDELYRDDNWDSLHAIKVQLEYYHPEAKELAKVKQLLSKLEKNRKTKAEEMHRKRMRAVNKLKKKYDDVSNITWYYNPYFTHYTNTNLTSVYMGEKEGTVWLRLEMSYTGDDWIFFETAYLSYDGNTLPIVFDRYKDKESDNSGGSVWEWIDVPVDDEMLSFLKEMVKGKSVKMRLSGKYTKTRNLSTNEVRGIEDVLLAYDVLKNGI